MNEREHYYTCLVEECAEVQHAATKILRFGLHDSYPGGQVNIDKLQEEVIQLLAVLDLIGLPCNADDYPEQVREKQDKVRHYLDYARANSALE